MTIQDFSQSVQMIGQKFEDTVSRTAALLQKVSTVIDDQKIFAETVRKSGEADQRKIQDLMSRYGATSDSELYNKIQASCTTMVQRIQEEKTKTQALIVEGEALLRSANKPLQDPESLTGKLSDRLALTRVSHQILSDHEELLFDQLSQMQQAPAPMEGVVEAPLPPQIERLVQDIDEKWKKPVSDLLSHLTPYALKRINSLQQVDLQKLLQLGPNYIKDHQGELAFIGLKRLIDLDPKVLEKLPHKVLRKAGPRAVFSLNPMVLNQLPDGLLNLLNGQNLEQFALLDDADIEYFRTMKPEQRAALGKYAGLIERIPLSKLMRLTANEDALAVLKRINESILVPTNRLEIPKEFWEDIYPEIWNEFSKDVCAALTPKFFDALYGITVKPHQYRSSITNPILTLLLEYLKSSPAITSDGLKIKIDSLSPEELARAHESTRSSEEAGRRKLAAYMNSYCAWLTYSGTVNLITGGILGLIYRFSSSALMEKAAEAVGVQGKVAGAIGNAAVMAECGSTMIVVGGVAVTALNVAALTHQIREWGPSDWAAAALVATGTGLAAFFFAPTAIPIIGAYLAEGGGISFASLAVKTAGVTGAINILTMPLAKLGRSIALNPPGEKKAVQKEQAPAIAPSIQATMERAAFLKTLTHLNAVAENLTEQARSGMLRPAIGREEELTTIMGTLISVGEQRSVMLLGEAGCGKTALINGLAYKIAKGDVPEELRNAEVFSVSLLRLQENTGLRGSIETKLSGLLEETQRNYERVVLFIDEAHLLESTGRAQGTPGIAEHLKAPLTGYPPLRLIGATTPREYDENLGKDPAITRRFMPIQVLRPDIPKTVEMIQGYYRQHWEAQDLVQIDDEAILAAATLAPERLPDSAIKLLEGLCNTTYASRKGRELTQITEGLVRDAVAKTQRPAPAPLQPVPKEPTPLDNGKRLRSPPPGRHDEESPSEPPAAKQRRKPAPRRRAVVKTQRPAPDPLQRVPEDMEEEAAPLAEGGKRSRSPSPKRRDKGALSKPPDAKRQRKPDPGEEM
jgi:hypothetical protein